MPLLVHEIGARQTQLHAGVGVDGIVDAAMPRQKAAEHLTVGGIDDGVGLKQRNVAAPDGNAIAVGECAGVGRPAALKKALLQVGVLYVERLGRKRLGQANVHKGSEQIALFAGSGRYSNTAPVWPLIEQCFDKPNAAFGLIHGLPPVRLRWFRSTVVCGPTRLCKRRHKKVSAVERYAPRRSMCESLWSLGVSHELLIVGAPFH